MSIARPVGSPVVTPVQSTGLVDDVYEVILDMLLSGELPADSNLGIDGLARQLQVSPTPVREVLARLEHTGLVLREPRRGYRVAPRMSPRQMAELIDARHVLECGAIRRAVLRDPDGLSAALEEALAAHRAAAEALLESADMHDLAALHRYFKTDWRFHQVILDHCGNRYIDRAVNGLSFSVHRMRQSVGAGGSDAGFAIAEHGAILEAVRTGDADEAERRMAEHLRRVADSSVVEAAEVVRAG